MMRPLGPGMMQQIQQPCSHCNQTGYATPPQDLCNACNGKVCSLSPILDFHSLFPKVWIELQS